jgi:predicted oxidoreductase
MHEMLFCAIESSGNCSDGFKPCVTGDFPNETRAAEPDTTKIHVQTKMEACLEQGISSFDQADIYGGYRCEQLLGAALKDAPHLRTHMEIITKCSIMLMTADFPERRIKY